MITLEIDKLRLVIAPETGGAIAEFTHYGAPILRPVADQRLAAQNGHAVAGYPLIPFANRIANGRFTFAGETYQLGLNFAGHPHTIHGNAWMRPWRTLHTNATSAHIALDHAPPHDPASQWPFPYHAEQIFTLHPNGLDLTLSVQNTGATPWPAGVGWHPYIARDPAGTTLQFDADTVWQNGPDSLPTIREAVAHHWDFTTARDIGRTEIDECYAGWGGNAQVTWPAQNRTMHTTTPMDHLQLYTPAGRDFFGLEPVSNMPDAINREDTTSDNGLKLLHPAETLTATIHFEVADRGEGGTSF
jgi:aldose 1-epimerase